MSDRCDGPLIWYSAGNNDLDGAVLECARCDYLIVAGNWNDDRHAHTPLLREGLAL